MPFIQIVSFRVENLFKSDDGNAFTLPPPQVIRRGY